MQFRILPVTPLQQNCTLLWDETDRCCAIVDPGGEVDRIVQALTSERLQPELILITHGHIDHAGGAAALARRLGLPIQGPQREDLFLLERLPQQAAMFGLTDGEAFTPDRWLEQGARVGFGDIELKVLHCPGHTPGHVVYFHPDSRLALVGDVLFKGSIGRTDFPRGDHQTLIDSIHQRLWPLGNEVRFIPGHGPSSTFGEERRSNPFVGDGR